MFEFLKINTSLFKATLLLLMFWIVNPLAGQSGEDYYNAKSPREQYYTSKIDETKFEEKNWKNAIEGIDYSGEVAGDKIEKKEKNPPGEVDIDEDDERSYDTFTPMDNSGGFFSFFFKLILLSIAAIGLALLIANMIGMEGFKRRPRSRKIQTKVSEITLENVEENIHESDLDRFIREALQQDNYALAVRLYYLAIIKELSLNRWIKWKKNKTNRDYIRELRNTNLHSGFREITRMFERVWYGDNELKGMDFRSSFQPQFQQMLDTAKKAGRKI